MYSFSRVVFRFFFQSKIANSFYSKINDSSEVKTTRFWSGRSGFESLPRQIFLWFHWHLSEFAIFPMAQRMRKTCFWSGRFGLESQPLPTLFDVINKTENRDTALLCKRNFENRIFLKPGRVPLRNFLNLWNKKIDRKSWYPPALLFIILLHTRKLLEHRRDPWRSFSALWDKKVLTESGHTPPTYPIFFPYQNFLETQKGSATKFCGTVKKVFSGKMWLPVPSYPWTLSHTIKFLKNRKVPLQSSSSQSSETESFGQNRDAPSPMHETIDTRIFLKHRSVPLRRFFGTVKQKIF